MIPPKIIITGNFTESSSMLGFAKKELKKLRRDMSYQGINEAYRDLNPVHGIFVRVEASFSLEYIYIHSGDFKDEEVSYEKEVLEEDSILKVFVHVDVLGKEDWDAHEDDLLVRSDVTSAISCGVIGMADGKILWSSSIDSEYLVNGGVGGTGGTEWAGVDSGLVSTEQELFAYYNSLFPVSPSYSEELPLINTEWLTQATLYVWDNWYYTSTDKITYYKLKSAYWGSLLEEDGIYYYDNITEPTIGWCYGQHYMQNGGITHPYIIPGQYQYWINMSDHFKWTDQNGLSGCSKITKVEITTYETSDIYNPDEHIHIYCTEPTEGEEIYNPEHTIITSHFIYESPVLGVMWAGPYNLWDYEGWHLNFCGKGNHVIENSIEGFIKSANDSSVYNLPEAISGDVFIDIQGPLDCNYILDDGFSWFHGFFGGNIAVKDYQYFNDASVSGYVGTNNYRSLLKISAKGGYNITALDGLANNELSESITTLAKAAISQVGGVIYDNTDIPLQNAGLPKEVLDDKIGIISTDTVNLPGLLYASPLFNIRVLAIPVKGEM